MNFKTFVLCISELTSARSTKKLTVESQEITVMDNPKVASEKGEVKLIKYKKFQMAKTYDKLTQKLTSVLDSAEQLIKEEKAVRCEMETLGIEIKAFKHRFIGESSGTPSKPEKRKRKSLESESSEEDLPNPTREPFPTFIPGEKEEVDEDGNIKKTYFCPHHPTLTFKRRFTAKQHMSTSCIGKKPFVCDMEDKDGKTCGKDFTRKQNLLEHQCEHTGIPIYVCKFKICEQSFTHSKNKSEHEAICDHKKDGLKPKKK